MRESETCALRAAAARDEAASATLDNIRDRALRSAATWQSMADRSRRIEDARDKRDAQAESTAAIQVVVD